MKQGRLRVVTTILTLSLMGGGGSLGITLAEEDPLDTHDEALMVVTEDPVLKEQILKVHEGLEVIHQELATRRQAIRQETDEARRAVLYAELDGLRKEHEMLERLLHDLIEEARATEWTKIDQALKEVRDIERYQDRVYRKEEVLRDRQQ
jgi:hypothetical protein